jgi:pimeloyl-ACP methyl ester carboxylesterase
MPLRKEFFRVLSLASLLMSSYASCQITSAADQKQTQGYLEIGGSKIYYEECGGGPNIVLLHDGLLHAVTWDESWPALCEKFHVVRYDRRGYGRSDAPKTKFSPTDDLQQIMTHANMKRAVIVGNSSGGALAIDFSLAHPESVDALFLIGPVVHGMPSTEHFAARGERNQAPLDHQDFKAAALSWSNDPYLIANGHDAARKKFYEDLIPYPSNLTYEGQFEIRAKSPAIHHLGEIHVPTFILVGEFDIPDVHAHCGAIEAGIPLAERDIIKGDGHLIQLEDPKLFTERLTRFANLQARPALHLSSDLLQAYAGRYDAGPVFVNVYLAHDQLEFQITDDGHRVPLFAESPSKFFMRASYLEVEFVKDSADKVTEMLVNQEGKIFKCRRVEVAVK